MRNASASIQHLIERAQQLSLDTPATEVDSVLSALGAGLPTDSNVELRGYLSLAHRFGYAADVWNAAQLLEADSPLDPAARVARATAWLQLFREVALRRPATLAELVDTGHERVSDSAKSDLLASWCSQATAATDRPDGMEALASTLPAVDHVADCWWPVSEWAARAPAFTAAYYEAAHVASQRTSELTAVEVGRLATSWSRALLLGKEVLVSTRPDGMTGPPVPWTGVEVEVATALEDEPRPLGQDELIEVGRRIDREKKRIWVIGGLVAKWPQLVGIGKQYGCTAESFSHVPYDEVRGQSLVGRLNIARDVGILVGPVPHSARGLDGYSSPVQQLRQALGIPVVTMHAQSTSNELRITNTSFRTGLIQLLTKIEADWQPSVDF